MAVKLKEYQRINSYTVEQAIQWLDKSSTGGLNTQRPHSWLEHLNLTNLLKRADRMLIVGLKLGILQLDKIDQKVHVLFQFAVSASLAAKFTVLKANYKQ